MKPLKIHSVADTDYVGAVIVGIKQARQLRAAIGAPSAEVFVSGTGAFFLGVARPETDHYVVIVDNAEGTSIVCHGAYCFLNITAEIGAREISDAG